MELDITGRRVLITGASQGIGRACALALAAEGAQVLAVARRGDVLEKLVEEMGGYDAGHRYCVSDLMEPRQPTRVAQWALEQGPLDLVVHNVGGTLQVKDPLAPLEDWMRVVQFNVGIAIEMNHLLVPPMRERKYGRVVHVSSISGEALRGSAAYAASKAFLNAYTKTLARGVAMDNVVVSAVMPGAVYAEGGHWDNVVKTRPGMKEDFLRHHMAIGRLGAAEEIAPWVVMLCSNQPAQFAAGALLPIDGGTM